MTTKQKTDLLVAQTLLINAFHLMQQSSTTTWNEELEDSFECVVMEDVVAYGGGEVQVKYSGWYEQLREVAKILSEVNNGN